MTVSILSTMNNSSTSNSEFKRFVAKMAVRAAVLGALCTLVFYVPLSREYYFSILKYSDYSKISWIENKLNETQNLDSTVVFVGSSICLNGVNDSLLNALDTSSTQYLNLGMTHTCFAIIDALLEDMLERRELMTIFCQQVRMDFKMMEKYIYFPDRKDAVPKLNCPLLLLGAQDDRIVPKSEYQDWYKVSDGEYKDCIFVDGGHCWIHARAKLDILSEYLTNIVRKEELILVEED